MLDRIAARLDWSSRSTAARASSARTRPRHRVESGDLADHVRRHRQRLRPTAACTVYCGTIDMGQGSDTAMAQIAGEVLNIPPRRIRVVPRDTDVTPYDMGTLGSRSLFHMGHAVRLAAEEAKAKIAALAREVGEPEGSNVPSTDMFVKKYGMQAGNIVGSGCYKPDYAPPDPATGQTSNATPFWMLGGRGRRNRGRYRDRARQDHCA